MEELAMPEVNDPPQQSQSDQGEYLGKQADNNSPQIYADIAASITQYTERPDLLINALEQHDPGFVKRMNEDARQQAEETRAARHEFGRVQAYTALGVSVVMAFGVLGALFFAIHKGSAGFLLVIALAAFLAISQGGRHGFLKIIEGVRDLLGKSKKEDG